MIGEKDLQEIIGKKVSSVLINQGSVTLTFGENGWILIQCSFVLHTTNDVFYGTATLPESATSLSDCLGKNIIDACYDEKKVLALFFENNECVRLIPEKDGLESYVFHSSQGIVPIIDF